MSYKGKKLFKIIVETVDRTVRRSVKANHIEFCRDKINSNNAVFETVEFARSDEIFVESIPDKDTNAATALKFTICDGASCSMQELETVRSKAGVWNTRPLTIRLTEPGLI